MLMLRYWFGVLWQAILSSFDAIGQTKGAIFYAAIVLLLGLGLAYVQGGWHAMKEQIVRNVLGALAIAALAWLPFFLWQLIRTPYLLQQVTEVRASSAETKAKSAEEAQQKAQQERADLESELREVKVQLAQIRTTRPRVADADAQSKRRLEIRTALGDLLSEANATKQACLGGVTDFPCKEAAERWYAKADQFISTNLESSYRARFASATGLSVSYFAAKSPDGNNAANFLTFKSAALTDFIREFRD